MQAAVAVVADRLKTGNRMREVESSSRGGELKLKLLFGMLHDVSYVAFSAQRASGLHAVGAICWSRAILNSVNDGFEFAPRRKLTRVIPHGPWQPPHLLKLSHRLCIPRQVCCFNLICDGVCMIVAFVYFAMIQHNDAAQQCIHAIAVTRVFQQQIYLAAVAVS